MIKKTMKRTANSEFIDQGIFYPVLYSNEYSQKEKTSVKLYGIFGIEMLQENRVKLWIDLQDWADYLIAKGFSFSCGSRIHGNIMPILCGIPAAICPPDARVREMAEFYEIPMISAMDLKRRDLYEIYADTNYALFNRNFAAKFDAYEAFLKERGIVKTVNNNPLLHTVKSTVDTQRLEDIHNLVHTERINGLYNRVHGNPGWYLYETARNCSISAIEWFNRPKG